MEVESQKHTTRQDGHSVYTAAASVQTLSLGERPDVKTFERKSAEINFQIKDLEAKLKSAQSDSSIQAISIELGKLNATLTEVLKARDATKAELKKIGDELKMLGEKVTKKKSEACALFAGSRYSTEKKIDDSISKLSDKIELGRLSSNDERKYKMEIAELEKSKIKLREYNETKKEVDEMREEQDQLRARRNSLYRENGELKDREASIRDKIVEHRTELDSLKEKKREAVTHKDTIKKEIYTLFERRRQLTAKFRQEQNAYEAERIRQKEMDDKKRKEDRKAQKEAAFRKKLNMEIESKVHNVDIKATARALIGHLQKLLGDEGQSLSSSDILETTTSITAAAAVSASAVSSSSSSDASNTVAVLDGMRESSSGLVLKPGEFLQKNREEVLVAPKRPVVRRKSKRDKKKSAPSTKAPKRPLQLTPIALEQFGILRINPPSTHAEIPDCLRLLEEKLTFYETKSMYLNVVPAYSEAGDSGVSGMMLSQAQSVATSQEDLSYSYHDISPKHSPVEIEKNTNAITQHHHDQSLHNFVSTLTATDSNTITEDRQREFSDDDSSQTIVDEEDEDMIKAPTLIAVTVKAQ